MQQFSKQNYIAVTNRREYKQIINTALVLRANPTWKSNIIIIYFRHLIVKRIGEYLKWTN